MATRIKWADEVVEARLRELAGRFGRMPSANELRAEGLGAMACRVTRTGGLLAWAKRLGLAVNKDGHASEFGESWEDYVTAVLRAHRIQAEPQRRHAPFDVLANGRVRINVKASRHHNYEYEAVSVRGFTFWLGDTWKRCDVFALVKVDGPTPSILWVPSAEAQQQTITLTKKHRLNVFTAMDVLDSF